MILTTHPLITSELFLLEDRAESPALLPAPDPPSTNHQDGAGVSPCPVLETLEQARAVCERAYLVHVLTATQGTVVRAAVLAGMHRGPFYKLLQKHALDPEAFRHATGPSHPLPLGEGGG